MKRISLVLAALFLASSTMVLAQGPPNTPPGQAKKFPSLDEQLKKAHANPGSELEKLIKKNQDFTKLKDKDADDPIVPPWLKVYWRKGHPEANYDNDNDPTGGYPLVLKEVLEWMMTHQDLKPGTCRRRPCRRAGTSRISTPTTKTATASAMGFRRITALGATAGTNVRTSGAQTVSRSESDIRINYWNPSKIIAASNNIGGSGMQGEYYSTDGGVTWGQTQPPARQRRRLPLRSDRRLDLRRHGVVDHDGHQLRADRAQSAVVQVDQRRRDVDVRRNDLRHADEHRQADAVDRPQRHVGVREQQLRHLAQRQPRLHESPHVLGMGNADPGQRRAGHRHLHRRRREDQLRRRRLRLLPRHRLARHLRGQVDQRRRELRHAGEDRHDLTTATTSASRRSTAAARSSTSPAAPTRTARRTTSTPLWTDLSGDTRLHDSRRTSPGTNVTSTCKTRIWFSRSTDGGATWSAAVKLNNQSGLNDQFNPFLAVDETNGNLGAIYYDTVADSGRKKVDVYYQLSTDGGATWQAAVKVTTAHDRRDGRRRRFGQPVRRLQQPLRLRQRVLPLLDRPPQQREGRDLDGEGDDVDDCRRSRSPATPERPARRSPRAAARRRATARATTRSPTSPPARTP